MISEVVVIEVCFINTQVSTDYWMRANIELMASTAPLMLA